MISYFIKNTSYFIIAHHSSSYFIVFHHISCCLPVFEDDTIYHGAYHHCSANLVSNPWVKSVWSCFFKIFATSEVTKYGYLVVRRGHVEGKCSHALHYITLHYITLHYNAIPSHPIPNVNICHISISIYFLVTHLQIYVYIT